MPEVRHASAAVSLRCPFCQTPITIKIEVYMQRSQRSIEWSDGKWAASLHGRLKRRPVNGGERHGTLDDGFHYCEAAE